MADKAEGDGVEQGDHPGVFEEGAKEDEQEDIGGRHQSGDAEDALGAEAELVDDLRKGVAAVSEVAGQILPEEAVEEKGGADQRQGEAHDAARRFENHGNHDRAHHQVGECRVAGTLDEIPLEKPLVRRQGETDYRQQPVAGGDARKLGALPGRIEEKGQGYQEADMKRPGDQAGKGVEGGNHQLVEGEDQRQAGQQPQGKSVETALNAMFGEVLGRGFLWAGWAIGHEGWRGVGWMCRRGSSPRRRESD